VKPLANFLAGGHDVQPAPPPRFLSKLVRELNDPRVLALAGLASFSAGEQFWKLCPSEGVIRADVGSLLKCRFAPRSSSAGPYFSTSAVSSGQVIVRTGETTSAATR
jgi:hypothetical protein